MHLSDYLFSELFRAQFFYSIPLWKRLDLYRQSPGSSSFFISSNIINIGLFFISTVNADFIENPNSIKAFSQICLLALSKLKNHKHCCFVTRSREPFSFSKTDHLLCRQTHTHMFWTSRQLNTQHCGRP